MYRIIFICFVFSSLLSSGCSYNQTLKDAWKYTNRQYYTYVNTPAELDMEATVDSEKYQLALGDVVLTVDEQLQSFIRVMENSDRNPDQQWVTNLMRRFPWLSGAALTDNQGNVIARYPEYGMKEFDVTPLLESDPKQRIGALRAYVQQTPLGPEVYLGNPVFAGEEQRGIITAYFDPRSLVTLSKNPGSFMLASPAGILWSGGFSVQDSPVEQTDWEELLRNRSHGTIGERGKRFYWTTRYLGNLPIVYVIPTDAGDAAESNKQEEEPGRADMRGAPPFQSNPSLMEGEVGDLGTPDVTPAPQSSEQENNTVPLEE